MQVLEDCSAQFSEATFRGELASRDPVWAVQTLLNAFQFDVSPAGYLCMLRSVGCGLISCGSPIAARADFDLDKFPDVILPHLVRRLQAWKQEHEEQVGRDPTVKRYSSDGLDCLPECFTCGKTLASSSWSSAGHRVP
jgi:hypothetical protein